MHWSIDTTHQSALSEANTGFELNTAQLRLLLASVFIIAACSLLYELLISSLSTYLLGSSVVHYSVTIGLFLFFMGVGTWLARYIDHSLIAVFVLVELGIGLLGGLSALLLFAVYVWSEAYYPAMLLVIASISTLVGLEIPILTRIIEQTKGLKKGISEVLTFDYLGALIASMLFPFVLLPWFGHLLAAAGTGLLNLAVALVVGWHFRPYLGRWKLPLALLAMTGLTLLAAVLVFVNPLTRLLEQGLYQDTVIHTEQSTYQKIVVTRWGDDTRLYLNGSLQFSSIDEHRYHEVIAHVPAAYARERQSALVIGGGDALAVRELLKYDSLQQITLVELDPAITELIKRLPVLSQQSNNALDDSRVDIVHADAWNWLESTADLFDVIIVDLPDPSTEDTARLYTVTFYQRLARRLAVGGVMITQATSPWFAPEAYWSIGETLEAVFNSVVPAHTYVPSFGPWGFFMAAQHDLNQPQHAIHEGRFISKNEMQALFTLPADYKKLPVEANTIGALPLLRYYQNGWEFVNKGNSTP